MRISFFIRVLAKLLLIMIIPILLIITRGWDSILPIIIYLQFLLIWAQVEIAMRQGILFSIQFEPSFSLTEDSEITSVNSHHFRIYSGYIHNVSNAPAYYVSISRIIDEQNKPIPPDLWPKTLETISIACLPPGQKVKLYSIYDQDRKRILDERLTFEVFYLNRLGDPRTLYIKFSKTYPPLLIHERISKPGILLNTFEEMALFFKFYKFRRVFHEKGKR